MITGSKQVTGLLTSPLKAGPQNLINITGPGVLVSGMVIKQGGVGDSTRVKVKLDGQTLFNHTFAGADAAGYDTSNKSGFRLTRGTDDALSFAFSEPLHFSTSFLIEIDASLEPGISQITGRCIVGASCSYPS